ncbi:MAG: hypothetical protein CXZ00_05950, partial [Acidobacteria bacterium]
RGSGASSATLQSPAPPQIPVPSLTLLAHFYSALLAYFYSALDTMPRQGVQGCTPQSKDNE